MILLIYLISKLIQLPNSLLRSQEEQWHEEDAEENDGDDNVGDGEVAVEHVGYGTPAIVFLALFSVAQVHDRRLARHVVRARRVARRMLTFGRGHLDERKEAPGRARRAQRVLLRGLVVRLLAAAAPARRLHREADIEDHDAEGGRTRAPVTRFHDTCDDREHHRNHSLEQRAEDVPREHRSVVR